MNKKKLHFCGGKCHILYLLYIGIIIGIIIGIGRYEKYHIGILSVSADKKIEFIGIGRYEKKLIGHTLYLAYLLLKIVYTFVCVKYVFEKHYWSHISHRKKMCL